MLSKVFILIPGGEISGGPETLHQLANTIAKYHKETYVVYFSGSNTVPEKYKKYNIQLAEGVEDNLNNLVVVPESHIKQLYKYDNVKKCVFWLSLNYYLMQLKPYLRAANSNSLSEKLFLFFRGSCVYFYKKITGKLDSIKRLKGNVFHLYNCEYVRNYLELNSIGGGYSLYLCGPLEKLYFEPLDKKSVLLNKENIIAYNPAKDHKYITQLQKVNTNNYQFVPIKGMTSQQVKELLLRAKLYVDFGYFPGPERIPRQAAMCYCSILTSNLGSAANDIDVPIPRENKIDVKHFKPKEVYKKVVSLIENFEQDISDYDKYRKKVIRQDLDFEVTIQKFIQRYSD